MTVTRVEKDAGESDPALHQPPSDVHPDPRSPAEDERSSEEEFHLGKAAEEELKRLATHPVRETERLRGEIDKGEPTGLAVLLTSVAFWVWLLAALLMVVVFLVAYLAT
jgi:hypothetical protein